jgi:hypothetical protein
MGCIIHNEVNFAVKLGVDNLAKFLDVILRRAVVYFDAAKGAEKGGADRPVGL